MQEKYFVIDRRSWVLGTLLILAVVMLVLFRGFLTPEEEELPANGKTPSTVQQPSPPMGTPENITPTQIPEPDPGDLEEPKLDLKAAESLLRTLGDELPCTFELLKEAVNLQALETILLEVKRLNPSCDEILAVMRSIGKDIPLPFILTLAYARGFSTAHASWLEELICRGREANRILDGSGFSDSLRAVAAAHVLRLRHATADLESLSALVKEWRTSRTEGIWNLQILAGLILCVPAQANPPRHSRTSRARS